MNSVVVDRAAGLSSATAIKGPCRVATTSNIVLRGEQTIAGVAVVDGDRVLVLAQTDAVTNGIYVASANEWARAKDFSRNGEVRNGTLVVVGVGGVYAVTSADPIVIGTDEIEFTNIRGNFYDVLTFGAHPENTAEVNTGAIQRAIDLAHTNGGGTVHVPYVGDGVYQTTGSSDTTQLGVIDSGPVLAFYPATEMVSLLLKSGVYLDIDPGVTIECDDPSKTIIGLLSMDGGGILGRCHIKNVWDEDDPTGSGHGIFTFFTTDPNNDPMKGLTIQGPEISHVASYGLGIQFGFMEHNLYDDLYVHDTGADAFDHKARPRKSDGKLPNDIFITRYRAELYGRRDFGSPSSCCAIDARGPVIIDGAQAYNFNKTGENHGGFRLSAGLYSGTGGIDYRASSANAILNNFTVDGGDPAIVGGGSGFGIALLDSASKADNGFIRNVDTGYLAGGSSSGYGSCFGAIGSNITVEGARVTSFDVSADHVSLINPIAIGQVETFEEDAGNLVAGQTVFVSPRQFVNATVQVYKNGTLLTLTTDYTKGASTTTITLVSGVLVSDVIEIVSPTPIGFTITGAYARIENPKSKYVTTARSIGGGANATYQERNPTEDGRPWFSEYTEAGRINLEAKHATLADMGIGLHAKGNEGIGLHSRGARAFRAANSVDSCVNWVQASGSTTGNPVDLSFVGSDTNGNVRASPKGAGVFMVPIANVANYANDAAASAGGVPVGGFYRNGSVLMIRVT